MRVALADDSSLFRSGLALLLDGAGVEVVLQVSTGDELLARMPGVRVDIAVLDVRMPPTFTDEGLVAAERIRTEHPGVAVLVLSTYAQTGYAVRLLTPGAAGVGYLLKDRVTDIGTLLDALGRLSQGETVVDPDIVVRLLSRQRETGVLDQLTERERMVLALMAEGRSNAGIGRELFLGTKTVERHIAGLFSHLGLHGSSDDNRRVLAVLTWLRSQPSRH